jgi:hypothetical protein
MSENRPEGGNEPKTPAWNFTVKDQWGGTLTCSYEYTPAANALAALIFVIIHAAVTKAEGGEKKKELETIVEDLEKVFPTRAEFRRAYSIQDLEKLFKDRISPEVQSDVLNRYVLLLGNLSEVEADERWRQIQNQLAWAIYQTFPRVVEHALIRVVLDPLSQFLAEMANQKPELFTVKGVDLLREFADFQHRLVKHDLGIPRPGGSSPTWTSEQKAEILNCYESFLLDIKEAKRLWRQNSRLNWRGIVKTAFPDLPDEIIESLSLKGEKPSDLALEATASKVGIVSIEYLKKLLTAARRARRNTGQ